jgi:tetratricopeptide (TPR) repeat protein
VLNYLGHEWLLTGDYPEAGRVLDGALAIFREIGDRGGEVEVLNERAAVHRLSGELVRAAEGHQQLLELSRAIGSAPDEAHALAGLGRCALAAGRAAQAETLLGEALQIMRRIGVPEAAEVAAEQVVSRSSGPACPPKAAPLPVSSARAGCQFWLYGAGGEVAGHVLCRSARVVRGFH